MIVIRAEQNTPITLTGASTRGNDVVLRRTGQHFTIKDDAFDGSSALFSVLKTKWDAGDVSIYVGGVKITTITPLQEAGKVSKRGAAWDQPHSVALNDTNTNEVHTWFTSDGGVRTKTGSPPTSEYDGCSLPCSSDTVVEVGGTNEYGDDDVDSAIEDAGTGATENDPVKVQIGSGTYTVDNPVSLRDNVYIEGAGTGQTVLVAGNAGLPMFNDTGMNGSGGLYGVTVRGGSIAMDLQNDSTLEAIRVHFEDQTDWAVKQTGTASTIDLGTCQFSSAVAATGFLHSGVSGAIMNVYEGVFTNSSSTLTSMMESTSGALITGRSLQMDVTGGTVTYAVQAGGGTVNLLSKSVMSGMGIALYATDNVLSMITGSGPQINSTAVFDIAFENQDASAAIIAVNAGAWDKDKVDGAPNGFRSVNNDLTSGREIYELTQGIAAGRPGKGRASFMGEGAPFNRGVKALQNSNLEIGTWTDVSTNSNSHVPGTTQALFGGVAANRVYYVGADIKFYGLEVNVSTALVLGSGTLQAEYWNGSAWTAVSVVAKKTMAPFTRRGDSILEATEVQTLSFDAVIGLTWATKDLNSETKYWLRIKIATGPITTDPVINWLELHTNSTRVHPDGTAEGLGSSRRSFKVPVSLNQTPAAGGPSSATLTMSANIAVSEAVEHPNGSDTYIIGELLIESWMDTSSGAIPHLEWKNTAGGTGDVDWKLTYALIKNTATEDVAHADATETISTTPQAAGVLTKTDFTKIDIASLTPGDKMVFKAERLGNTDAYGDSVIRRAFWLDIREGMRGE